MNKTFREDKEKLEKKLEQATVEKKALHEKVAAMGEEIKKAKGSKNYYLDKILKLEAGEIITQQATNIVMQDFFTSEPWKNTQIDNFISSNRSSLHT